MYICIVFLLISLAKIVSFLLLTKKNNKKNTIYFLDD